MTELSCSYGDDRDEAIVAFLYDDPDDSGGRAGAVSSRICRRARAARPRSPRCAASATQLARWSPPELRCHSTLIRNPPSAIRNGGVSIPVWAQVAAALLFLGVSAGIANLDVHYDRQRLERQDRLVEAGGARAPQRARRDARRPRPWKADSPRSSLN